MFQNRLYTIFHEFIREEKIMKFNNILTTLFQSFNVKTSTMHSHTTRKNTYLCHCVNYLMLFEVNLQSTIFTLHGTRTIPEKNQTGIEEEEEEYDDDVKVRREVRISRRANARNKEGEETFLNFQF